jgi:CrcB protein
MSQSVPVSGEGTDARQYDAGNQDTSLETIQSRRSEDRQQATNEADDGYAAAPLSELLVQPPADWSRQQQPNGNAVYGGDRRPEGFDVPLAELVSGPPVSRLSPTTSRERAQRRPSATATSKPSEGHPHISKLATQLYTVSYLVFFSIFGTLARVGLQALTFYPGAPVVTGVLWANVGGCILMGFFIEDRNIFREEWGTRGEATPGPLPFEAGEEALAAWVKKHKTVKKTIPLYIGLTTGFCGSFTSFSSFMRDTFLALSNSLPNPSRAGIIDAARNRGDSFMSVVAVMIVTVSLSMSALLFGAHIAIALDPWIPVVPFRFVRKILDRVVVFLAWGCWLGAIFMAIWPPDRFHAEETWRGDAIFAIVFAPLGCLLRFYVSLYLNARIPAFPLGTFTVNIFGTAILGMCYDLQHVAGIGAASLASKSVLTSCQVLQGVMDGFCGSLTTVSTWVAELNGMGRRRHAYLYGGTSVGIALALLVVIMGSVRWTIGFVNPVCS